MGDNYSEPPEFIDERTSSVVVVPFLNLGDNHWWKLLDRSGTEEKVVARSVVDGTFDLTSSMGGKPVANEITTEADGSVPGGVKLRIRRTTRDDAWTWGAGVEVPATWVTGRPWLEAVSDESHFPSGKLRLKVRLEKWGAVEFPVKGLEAKAVTGKDAWYAIQIRTVTQLESTFTKVHDGHMIFFHGVGLGYAWGRVFDKPYRFNLADWSGSP
jgi:hypothetical protein